MRPKQLALVVSLILAGCGGSSEPVKPPTRVAGPGFSFRAPSGWQVQRSDAKVGASQDSELVQVASFRLLKPYRSELFDRVEGELSTRMGQLAQYMTTELDPVAVEHLLASLSGHSPRGDGGALLFHIESPDGSVLFQDTSGHWTGVVDGLRPDVAIVAAAGRANIDGEPIQGALADFVADHVARLQPRRVVLAHHDDWLPGFSVPTDVTPIRKALAERAPTAELLTLDYVDATPIL